MASLDGIPWDGFERTGVSVGDTRFTDFPGHWSGVSTVVGVDADCPGSFTMFAPGRMSEVPLSTGPLSGGIRGSRALREVVAGVRGSLPDDLLPHCPLIGREYDVPGKRPSRLLMNPTVPSLGMLSGDSAYELFREDGVPALGFDWWTSSVGADGMPVAIDAEGNSRSASPTETLGVVVLFTYVRRYADRRGYVRVVYPADLDGAVASDHLRYEVPDPSRGAAYYPFTFTV